MKTETIIMHTVKTETSVFHILLNFGAQTYSVFCFHNYASQNPGKSYSIKGRITHRENKSGAIRYHFDLHKYKHQVRMENHPTSKNHVHFLSPLPLGGTCSKWQNESAETTTGT